MVLMHGKGLEDGTINAFLKMYNLVNTTNNFDVSSILHDKSYTKLFLKELGIDTVESRTITNINQASLYYDKCIIKGTTMGSSIGVMKAHTKEELIDAVMNNFKYDEKILIEKEIEQFVEYNQAVYIKDSKPILSCIEMIKLGSNNDIYSFNAKYKGEKIVKELPANIDEKLENKINNISSKIAEEFNIRSVIRIDYIYDTLNNVLYVNEINVIPGALSYYLYEAKGIYFKEIIEDMITNSYKHNYLEKQKTSIFKSNVLNIKEYNKK